MNITINSKTLEYVVNNLFKTKEIPSYTSKEDILQFISFYDITEKTNNLTDLWIEYISK